MISEKQILAARANGVLSRGPKTPEGKARSSRNAIRHGLLSRCVVLGNENPEGFEKLLNMHVDRFSPLDDVEMGMVEDMAESYWRRRRALAIETRLLDEALDRQPKGNEVSRIAGAFTELAATPQLNLLHRYETRLHMMYQRSLRNLTILRAPNLHGQPEDDGPEAPDPAGESPSPRPADPEPPQSLDPAPPDQPGHSHTEPAESIGPPLGTTPSSPEPLRVDTAVPNEPSNPQSEPTGAGDSGSLTPPVTDQRISSIAAIPNEPRNPCVFQDLPPFGVPQPAVDPPPNH